MSSLERALAWANLGFKVHPCYAHPTWKGSRLHEAKTPVLADWPNVATRDPYVIGQLFPEGSDLLVGVVPLDETVLLDVDVDVETGKDGFASLTDAGFDLPESFNVCTRRGGSHYLYKRDPSLKLGPLADVRLKNQHRLVGVDRRAGNSYFIAWSDLVPESLDSLGEAPEWLLQESSSSYDISYKGSIEDWLQSLPENGMHHEVAKAINAIPKRNFGHDDMIRQQALMVRLGAEGKPGVRAGLHKLAEEWLRGEFNTAQYRQDFVTSLAGAIAKFGSVVPIPEQVNSQVQGKMETTSENSETETDGYESLVREQYLHMKARIAAERMLADEAFRGSNILTWDELEESAQEFLVEDLIAAESLNFLVARRNLGKTFSLIDLICHMAFELPWLGKATRRVPILFVLGEGKPGIFQRVKAWCEENSKDIDELKEWITWVERANLSSDVSIERLESAVRESGAELVIVDTWSATSGVQDENAAGPTAEIIKRLTNIEPRPAFLITHHPTKSSQDSDSLVMRGSGALEGSADTVMVLFKDKDKKLPGSGSDKELLALSTESDHGGKNRNSRTETIRGLYLDAVGDSTKVLKHTGSQLVSPVLSKVSTLLDRPMTSAEFAAALGETPSTANRRLEMAMKAGLVGRERRQGSRAFVYKPVQSSLESLEPNYANLVKKVEEQEALYMKKGGK